jgi:hypothetical protein
VTINLFLAKRQKVEIESTEGEQPHVTINVFPSKNEEVESKFHSML